MKRWIVGIFAASLLGSLAEAVCPPGRVRPVLRMVCGLICALAVASPLAELDMDRLAARIAAYSQKAEQLSLTAEEEGRMMERTYIEERCAAYILSKGAALGVETGEVSVLAAWDAQALVWVPWETTAAGAYSGELSRLIESELGVPAERQVWNGGG